MAEQCETKTERPIANCDQEAWVMQRIRTTIDMAMALKSRKNVDADDPMYKSAFDGLVNGAAWEIIRTLGMEPEYANIKNPYGQPYPDAPLCGGKNKTLHKAD
jgi:hypothetical protein